MQSQLKDPILINLVIQIVVTIQIALQVANLQKLLLVIVFAIYFLPELIFVDAMLYIVGGIAGGKVYDYRIKSKKLFFF